MANIRLSHMHHWKTLPYREIPNFRDFYYEDKGSSAYYSDWDKILKYGSALGYEGVELLPWDLPELLAAFGTLEAFRDFAAERGCAVSGMFHGMDGARDRREHPALIAQAKRAVGQIAALGGRHMNVSPESDWHIAGPLTEAGIQNIAACLDEIGRYAADRGVLVGIHTEFSCAVNRENHRILLESTDPRYVSHCLDTAPIAMMGEDIAEFYQMYHDRICAIHLKDTADPNLPDALRRGSTGMLPDDGHRWFWEPGMGTLDFPALWRSLKAFGFSGWVTVETDGTPDLLASMALSAYYVRRELAEIYF